MSLSTPFIHRPVGTTLLVLAIALAGMLGYFLLPVSPLPEVEYPTIQVFAGLLVLHLGLGFVIRAFPDLVDPRAGQTGPAMVKPSN